MSRLLRLALVLGLLPLAAQAQTTAIEAARSHAVQAVDVARATPADFVVTDVTRNARTGAEHVYLRQAIAGLDVVGSEATVAVARTGAVVHAAGLERAVATPRVAAIAPALDAAQAASAVAQHNGLGFGAFGVVAREGGPSQAVTLSEGGVALEPVPARLVWHAGDGTPRLAWEVMLYQADAEHAWLTYVDARDGAVLHQIDLVVHDTFGEPAPRSLAPVRAPEPALSPYVAARGLVGGYRVYGMPVEAPIYASTLPPADGRTLISNPDDATASPFGWHDTNGSAGAEYTTTRGNNVHAYTDVDANNSPDSGSSPNGSGSLVFDFPLDLSQAPSAYRPASVTNLFYWNNVIHDVMYQYGFDEASGNFQVNNYGNGGNGNDDVRAEAQDGGGTNNANFFTPSDGSRPRMQMYIGTYSNPDVDGSFDNGVVVHEYGHGISNRLTGGPSQSGCLGNGEQMGEGWSDWYAMLFTMDAADSRSQSRGMGNYLFDYGATGGGIRLAPYDTDFGDNPYTYGDTKSMTAVHQIGFVWATILWEVTWDMIDAHGFSPDLYDANGLAGNQIMMNLVTEGLKLQPCSPGFVSGRDGILAADQNLYGGAHAATLQAAFARRGLGYSASEGSTRRNRDNKEAFDPWPGGGGGGGGDLVLNTELVTKGRKTEVRLTWTPADGGTMDVFRNTSLLAQTADDGSYSDKQGGSGDEYHVCETGTTNCSNTSSSLTGASPSGFAADGAIDTEVRVAPNPMATSARVTFGLEEAGDVELAVFNAIGQRVAVLASGAFEAGNHHARFDAAALPSGVYLYRLITEDEVQTGRIAVVR